MRWFHFTTPHTARRLYEVDEVTLDDPLGALILQALLMLAICLLLALMLAGTLALIG